MKQNFYKCVRLAAGLLLCVSLTFCSGKAGGKSVSSSSRSVGDAESTPQNVAGQDAFPFPAIPETMTEPQERRSYLLLHYWDNYDFADTVLLHRADVTEQGLVNYVALAGTHPDKAEAD